MGKSGICQKNFDQDAMDRVVRLVEDRIVAETSVDAPRVPGSSPKARGFMAHGSSMDLSRPVVRETSQSLFLKTWPPKTRGYAAKIKSFATLMSY